MTDEKKQSAALAPNDPNEVVYEGYTRDQIRVIKSVIAPDLSDNELKMFLATARRSGLDPFQKQISVFKDRDRISIVTTIDGFRVIADRSGKYGGPQPNQWCGEDGAWKEAWTSKDHPVAARASVLRTDFREPCVAVAHMDEFFKKGFKGPSNWERMPRHMLAKVAEAHALRKAFPNDLSGIYTDDEIGAEVKAGNGPTKSNTAVAAEAVLRAAAKRASADVEGEVIDRSPPDPESGEVPADQEPPF